MAPLRLVTLCIAALTLLIYSPAAIAAEYSDPMESAASDDARELQNLSPLPVSGAGSRASLYDKSLLSFTALSQPFGRVTYRARGCSRITVGIYTHTGTFAHRQPGGRLAFGIQDDSVAANRRPAGYEPVYFSPSSLNAYAGSGGASYPAVADDLGMAFVDPADYGLPAPGNAGNYIGYGVNVYASPSGNSYTRLKLSPGMMSYTAGANYCYEEFTSPVPAGTAFIAVEINDFYRYYDLSINAWDAKVSRYMTSLAMVSLTGDDLIVGYETPAVTSVAAAPPETTATTTTTASATSTATAAATAATDPINSTAASTSAAKSSVTKTSATKTSATKAGTAAAEDEEKTKATKFEGVITARRDPAENAPTQISGYAQDAQNSGSPPPAVSSKAVKAYTPTQAPDLAEYSGEFDMAAQNPGNDTEPPVPISETNDAAPETGPVFYEGGQNPDDGDAFSTGIVIYMFAAGAAVLFILLRAKK